MTYKQDLSQVSLPDLPFLTPGRPLDRLIAQNVLRCRWHTTFHWEPGGIRKWHWCNSRHYFAWGGFRPSTDPKLALALIEAFVDEYSFSRSSFVRFDLLISPKKHWTAKTILVSLGEEHEVMSVSKPSLPLTICIAMLGTYIKYGPKDYANGWVAEVKELSRKR